MNTPVEQPLPRQPHSPYNDPPRRPPNGPDCSSSNGEGEEPPRPSRAVAVTDLTLALTALAPAVCHFIEHAQLADLRTQALVSVVLQEVRRHSADIGRTHLGITALGAAITDVRRELAELRRRGESSKEALDQLAGDVQGARESQEKWTGDFTARHVADPMLAGYAELLGNLWQHARTTDPVQRPCFDTLADDVVRFLDAVGIGLVRPAQGDRLDPHRHQAISTVTTEDPVLHGCVAVTYQPGLYREERLIQPARVAVFTHKPTTQITTQSGERNTP